MDIKMDKLKKQVKDLETQIADLRREINKIKRTDTVKRELSYLEARRNNDKRN